MEKEVNRWEKEGKREEQGEKSGKGETEGKRGEKRKMMEIGGKGGTNKKCNSEAIG